MSELNKEQQERLKELETIIDNGMNAWQDVAKALAEVKESNLFIGTHKEFHEYALDRFGLSEEYANCYVRAGRVLMILGDASGVGRIRESHCRELSKAGDADNIRKLWDACKRLKKLTAGAIANKRDEVFFDVDVVPEDEQTEVKVDPWEQLKEDYRRLVKLPKNAPELLSSIRGKKEGDFDAVLSVPVGSTHYVILAQGEQYQLWRYLWSGERERYVRHKVTLEPVPLADALALMQTFMPQIGIPEVEEDADDEYEEEVAA